jgi:integrase
MRRGKVLRRCSKCGARLVERQRSCTKCYSESFKWQATVDVAPKGAARRQKSQSFKTRADATAWIAKRQTAEEAGTHIEPSRHTLGAYLESWLVRTADLEDWEQNTRREYGGSVARIRDSRIGSISLQALTTEDIRAYYNSLLKDGRLDGRGALSRKSVHNVNICLRSALQDAVEQDPPLLRRNPASKAFKYSRKSRVEMKTWTTEETQQFLVFTAHDADRALYMTAVLTGMRRGELLGLRIRDLDLDHGRLNVRQQYARDGAKGLAVKGLKNDSAGWRTVDLGPVVVEQLRAHLTDRKVVPLNAAEALVFCESHGSPLDPDSMARRFGRRVLDAGVPDIRFHDLRHTRATQLLENGESLLYVADQIGDRKETVLETYGHITSRTRTQAASRLEALIFARRYEEQITISER